MSTSPDPISPDELLRHADAMKSLARSLVRDPGLAEDLVQDSWLAFLRRPPRDPGAAEAWLRTVLRNFAWRRGRKDRSRLGRERAVARRERIDATPEEILERTELHRQVVDLVLGLEEPHRALILCRFFEGMSPREIGRREGIPVTTVRSRIARALERLRVRLDQAHGGNRLAWCAAFAALAGFEAEAAAASAGALAEPASRAIATWGIMTSGGLIVTAKKLGLAFAVATLLLLGIGSVFHAIRDRGDGPRIEDGVARLESGQGAGAGTPAASESTPGGVDTAPAAATKTAAVAVDERPISLEGRVVNAEGQGIAGATVVAVDARSWQAILLGIEERYPDPLSGIQGLGREFADLRRRSPSVATAEDGSYAIRGLAEGEHRVLVSHPEHVPGPDARAVVAPGSTPRCDVELAAGGSIAGLVVDVDGKPVEGALVSSRSSQDASARGMGKVMMALGRFVEGSALAAPDVTRSGRDGSFRLRGLEPVLQDIRASLAGRLDGRMNQVPPGARGVKLVLPRGVSIRGRLLDREGKPVAGARLALEESMGHGPNKDEMMMTADLDLFGEKSRSGESDGEGRFSLAGVAEGHYELTAGIGKIPVLIETVAVGKEAVDLGELTVRDLAPIAGKVLGPEGRPVEGALVRVSQVAEDGHWRAAIAAAGLEAKSGPDGEFSIATVPAGQWRISATAAEYAPSAEDGVGAGARGLVLRLGETALLAGVCLDAADRSPVAGAAVKLDGADGLQATSGDQGEFLLPCPPSQSVRFRVSHPEYEVTPTEARRDGAEPIAVLLNPARGVRGTVLDGQGNAVRGARVQIEIPGLPQVLLAVASEFNDALASLYSDAEGRFFVRLPRGGPVREAQIDVAARHPAHGKGRVRLPPDATAGSLPDVEIVLSPGVALEGRILDASGSPIAGAQVRAVLSGEVPLEGEMAMLQLLLASSSGSIAYTNPAGRFRIPSLEPGLHRLEVTALGYAKKKVESVAVGEATPALDVVLDAGGSISGRVVDLEGAPLAGIEVLAFFAEEPVMLFDHVDLAAMAAGRELARTDRQGVFTLTHLPETAFSVVARAAGFQLARAGDVRPGDVVPDMVLIRNGSVSGRVLDAETGLAVGDFTVHLGRDLAEDERPPEGGGARIERTLKGTLEGGVFHIEDVPPGRYEVRVSSTSHKRYHETLRIEPAREARFEARLERGLRIEGVVLATPPRAPLGKATVILARAQTTGDGSAPGRIAAEARLVTGEDGSFAFGALDPGDYQLWIEHSHYFLEDGARRVSLADGTPSEPIELLLSPAGGIQGRLRSRGSRDSAPGFHEVLATRMPGEGEKDSELPEIILAHEDPKDGGPAPAEILQPGGASIRARVRPNGEYALEGLRPGSYRLAIARYDEPRAPNDVRKTLAPVVKGEPVDAGVVDVAGGEVKTVDLEAP